MLGADTGQFDALVAQLTQKQRARRIQAAQVADGERATGMTTAMLLWPMLERTAELGERVNIEYALERQTIAIAA